jgi:nucleoside-diphosphate-sugar epimerase
VIVGEGFLARAFAPHFREDPDTLVFASGVSNSLETSKVAFDRERRLLQTMLAKGAKRFVYFGSCGVSVPDTEPTAYMQHKRSMESLLLSTQGSVILRLPQVVGFTRNTHTLTNFLRDHIRSGEYFSIWSTAERNLVDIDDVVAIGIDLIARAGKEPQVFSIAARESTSMPEIVRIFERVLGYTANCSLEQKGEPLRIDAHEAIEAAERLGIDLGDGYLECVIKKYYASSAETGTVADSC